jgi:esterase/lipase superfamily enzyme
MSNLRNEVVQSTNHLRVYCANDGALAASSKINGSDERLGFCAGPKTKMQGVEVVAVRGVSKDFGNHSYYLNASEVLEDIRSLLVDRQPSFEHRVNTVR